MQMGEIISFCIFRKLYEPHLFPLAPILPLYTKYFGEPEDRKNQVRKFVFFAGNFEHQKNQKNQAKMIQVTMILFPMLKISMNEILLLVFILVLGDLFCSL